MRIVKIVFSLIIVLAILVFGLDILVKEVLSKRVEASIEQLLDTYGFTGASLDSLTIDILQSTVDITNLTLPIPASENSLPGGALFSFEDAVISFSRSDALSMLSEEATLNNSVITIRHPRIQFENSYPFITDADRLLIEFTGELNPRRLEAAGLADLMDGGHSLNITMENLSIDFADILAIDSFRQSMEERERPVTGFELAFITTLLLPDIPLTRDFSQKVLNSGVSITPEALIRALDLGTGFLGMGAKRIVSSGSLTISGNDQLITIDGLLNNDIGSFSITGSGTKAGESPQELTSLLIRVTNLNPDLRALLEQDSISLELKNPILLEDLLQGDYSLE